MKQQFLLGILILYCPLFLVGQDLILDFSNSDHHKYLIKNNNPSKNIVEGIEGEGYQLKTPDDAINIKKIIGNNKDYTFSFWFYIENLDEPQPFLYIESQNKKLQVEIHQNKLLFFTISTNEDQPVSFPFKSKQWYLFSFSRINDGLLPEKFKLFIKGKDKEKEFIVPSYKSFFLKANRIIFGKNYELSDFFQGHLDEMILHKESLDRKVLETQFETNIKKTKEKKLSTKNKPNIKEGKDKKTEIDGEGRLDEVIPEENSDNNNTTNNSSNVIASDSSNVSPTNKIEKGDSTIQKEIVTKQNKKPLTEDERIKAEIGSEVESSNTSRPIVYSSKNNKVDPLDAILNKPRKIAKRRPSKIEKRLNERKNKKNTFQKISDPLVNLEKYEKRKNVIQDSLKVGSPKIILTFWDDDKIDGDVVAVKCFYEKKSQFSAYQHEGPIKLAKKRRKVSIPIRLQQNVNNYLRFDAVDLGTVVKFNTVTLYLEADGVKTQKTYKMRPNEKISAVLKIIHDKNVKGFEEFTEEQPSKRPTQEPSEITLPVAHVNNQIVELSYQGDETALVLNSNGRKKRDNVTILEKALPFLLNDESNTLYIKSNDRDIKEKKIVVKLKINGSTRYTEALNLSKNRSYKWPIIVNAPARESSTKELLVKKTKIYFKIWDAIDVDGDIITIQQDGKDFIKNFTLKGEKHTTKIATIPTFGESMFLFIPVSEGTRESNTTKIQIFEYGTNKKIKTFSLKAKDINQPAVLVIRHSSN